MASLLVNLRVSWDLRKSVSEDRLVSDTMLVGFSLSWCPIATAIDLIEYGSGVSGCAVCHTQ